MVYVLDKDGRPLMPTKRHGKVRRLLRDGLAVVVRRIPFTIRLLFDTTNYKQNVTLGIDAGSKHVGVSASTQTEELFSSEVLLRNDIVNLLSTRREARKTRRSRKLRYRAARFDNRRKGENWLAPSVMQKVDSHIKIANLVCSILPIDTIVIETAQFDTQKIKNPDISREEYSHGEQEGFWNVREYVLWRDAHVCQHCKGKSGDKVLNVHHLESRKTGGDSPDNLITLCETCHKAYHRGEIELKAKRRSKSLRDAAFMGIMRWRVYELLKHTFSDKTVKMTYGYKTKRKRIENGIEKTHCADAYCIAGNLNAKRIDKLYRGRFVARHTRSLHVFLPKKGGIRRSAIASHWIGKSRLQRFDTVRYNGIDCFISGSTSGSPILRDFEWKQVAKTQAVNPKYVKFLSRKHNSLLFL